MILVFARAAGAKIRFWRRLQHPDGQVAQSVEQRTDNLAEGQVAAQANLRSKLSGPARAGPRPEPKSAFGAGCSTRMAK